MEESGGVPQVREELRGSGCERDLQSPGAWGAWESLVEPLHFVGT